MRSKFIIVLLISLSLIGCTTENNTELKSSNDSKTIVEEQQEDMVDDEEETNIDEDHSEWSGIYLEITTDDYVWVDESVGFADEKSDKFKFTGYSEKIILPRIAYEQHDASRDDNTLKVYKGRCTDYMDREKDYYLAIQFSKLDTVLTDAELEEHINTVMKDNRVSAFSNLGQFNNNPITVDGKYTKTLFRRDLINRSYTILDFITDSKGTEYCFSTIGILDEENKEIVEVTVLSEELSGGEVERLTKGLMYTKESITLY